VLGNQVVPGSEPTGAAATRLGAVVAINGGFFARSTGHPLGLVVIDGRVLSTPWGRRSVFAIREDRTPVIDTFAFRGTVRTPRGIVPISAVNRPPRPGGVALYTPEYGPRTPPDALHAVVRGGQVVAVATGHVEIPPDGYVLTASIGQVAMIQGTMRRGDPVEVRTSLHPGGIRHALGAGPRLVQGGRLHIPYAWEGFRPSLYRIRTSRSAVGITGAGKVLFVAVEGRDRQNTGMSLVELARLMRDLGAVEAMNLDGGGSATLVVGGRVVNRAERAQRPVSSMLVVRYNPQE
jgi:exopolysaccharide biosynthesis protein